MYFFLQTILTKKMKHLLLISFLFSATIATAQTAPVRKVYAYSQQILPGKKPSGIVSKKESFRLFITSSSAVTVTGVWIKSSYYRFETISITKTPVLLGTINTEKKVLVPSTKLRVTEISIKKMYEPSPRPGTPLSTLLASNEVVIVYKWKGKEYFATAAKMEELEPFAAM